MGVLAPKTRKKSDKKSDTQFTDTTNIFFASNSFYLPEIISNFRALVSQLSAWCNLMRRSFKSPHKTGLSAVIKTNFGVVKKNVLENHSQMRADAFPVKHIDCMRGSVIVGHALLKKIIFHKQLKVIHNTKVDIKYDMVKVLRMRENWKNIAGAKTADESIDEGTGDDQVDNVDKTSPSQNDPPGENEQLLNQEFLNSELDYADTLIKSLDT